MAATSGRFDLRPAQIESWVEDGKRDIEISPLKGWQVRKRVLGRRPLVEAKVSRAERPDQHWATVLCRVWDG